MWSASSVVYSVGGPPYDLPRHAPVAASTPETKRVECSRDALAPLAGSGQGPGTSPTYRRGLRADARLEELDDQEVQLWKKRSCALATAARTARRHGIHTRRVRTLISPFTAASPYLMQSRTRSWTRCPPSRPIRIDFLFTHGRRRYIGALRLVAPREPPRSSFSLPRPKKATRTRARSPTRREVVPQWRSAAPSCGQARKRRSTGPRELPSSSIACQFFRVLVENSAFLRRGRSLSERLP